MSGWAARLALGHLGTASVTAVAGTTGLLGGWWLPVAVGSGAAAAGAAIGVLYERRRVRGLSRLARALDPRTWEQDAVTVA